MKRHGIITAVLFTSIVLSNGFAPLAAAGSGVISKSPYLGAILVDASTGKALFEDGADAAGYPASMVKLMDLLIVLEMVESNVLSLQDSIRVPAAAAKIGGSQVYLKENEIISVDDMLYALIVQSANDAAVALALHVAGTKEAFVELMNARARELGMNNTVFHSVHGLPPGKGQQPDVTTPRDMAKLCLELLKRQDVLNYTSTRERAFRPDTPEPFIMRTHNHLLGHFEGCDGLKTGYFARAGFSVAATAEKKGARTVAVVMGSSNRKVRDAKAGELLARGLAQIIRTSPVAATSRQTPSAKPAHEKSVKKTTAASVSASNTPPSGAGPDTPAQDGTDKNDDTIQISKKKIRIAGIVTIPLIIVLIGFYITSMKRKS